MYGWLELVALLARDYHLKITVALIINISRGLYESLYEIWFCCWDQFSFVWIVLTVEQLSYIMCCRVLANLSIWLLAFCSTMVGPTEDDDTWTKPVGRCSVVFYGVGHMLNDITSACWFTYLLVFLTDIGLSPRYVTYSLPNAISQFVVNSTQGPPFPHQFPPWIVFF